MNFDVNSLLQYFSLLGYDCVILSCVKGLWYLDRVGRKCDDDVEEELEGVFEC